MSGKNHTLLSVLFPVLLALLSPSLRAQSLEEDVAFLCDTLRQGRATGSKGAVDAAMFIHWRFESLGLRTTTYTFDASDGKVGHNVCGRLYSRKGSVKWIVVAAHYDALGTSCGEFCPSADSNASGTAALLSLASSFAQDYSRSGDYPGDHNVLFAALDAHYNDCAGAANLIETLMKEGVRPSDISLFVNLETMGSRLAPVKIYWKEYLIILGGARYASEFERYSMGLKLYYDYYDSPAFTNMFYRDINDQKHFLSKGVPCVMFTSGITMNTNKPSDLPQTLDYDQMRKRIRLIYKWLKTKIKL